MVWCLYLKFNFYAYVSVKISIATYQHRLAIMYVAIGMYSYIGLRLLALFRTVCYRYDNATHHHAQTGRLRQALMPA